MDISATVYVHPTGHDVDRLLAFTEAADVVEPGIRLFMTCQGDRRRAIRLLERFS